ncbi:type II toxin-antitoxin system VapB family antitoxin [Methylobacterium sp. J-043]|uniref:type II toxin-antitoxin system VapB family antitoxin n=1 Tax=Methylorubrum TaxID=2282523 RepID=UPI00209C99D6|nr:MULTISPECIES: type II toxin-antitoxin system VapB family antitoxin [Methylorubrum]MCJ2031830.1 type II toxin-antitoxin system VapB family antitoxin [Methylobacterium sp. J-043]MCP1547367.1 antitoxin VapB [Methylorubrum zatmanii]MCP1556017.1 antitoxin VapB [Methylorubrum extorquens]MCP1577670.1 antitoxin VapB [Methylorubrum extorquens]
MALHIRDAETDRLVRLLAERKGVPLTEAIKVAVRNELERDEARPGLWERLRPLHERVTARPSTGLDADKAFSDGLNDE